MLVGGWTKTQRMSDAPRLMLETPEEIPESIPYEVTMVAARLDIPWDLELSSDNRLLVSERGGTIRSVDLTNGVVSEALYTFEAVGRNGEQGLMGMALDPDYTLNGYVYVCVSELVSGRYRNQVVRLVDSGDAMEFDTVILDSIPAAKNHAGCRVAIGPDNYLYVTVGDALDGSLAQDPDSLAGKILRMNLDGGIPADNPTNSLVYSLGHRNPQGIDWHPESGALYASEHGPSVFDGPPGGDEINLIVPGGNYGWPVVSHERTREGMIDPVGLYTPAIAPASAVFYDNVALPQFRHKLLLGGLRGEDIYVVTVDSTPTKTERLGLNLGRIRDIVVSSQGNIFFGTSNTDGRGSPKETDDGIYVIRPKES